MSVARRDLRFGIKIVVWLAVAALACPSQKLCAQEVPTEKEFAAFTSGGVDVRTGQFKLTSMDISVGSGDFPSRLDFVRENIQYPRQADRAFLTSNFHLSAACFPCDASSGQNNLTVKAFDGIHTFKGTYVAWGSPRTWTNSGLDGAQVIDTGGALEFRSKAGDQIFFAANNANGTGIGCGGWCRVPIYATMASGQSIVFTYEGPPTSTYSLSRLTSVTNSRGYGLQFGYMNPSLTTGNADQRRLLTSVSAFRSGCVAIAVSCTTGSLASVSYSWTYVGANVAGEALYRLTSFINSKGRILNYEYNGPGYRITAAAFADNPTLKIFQNTYSTVAYGQCDEGKVLQQKDVLLQTTLYSANSCFSTPRDRPSASITPPNGAATIYKFDAFFDGSNIGLPTSVQKPLSRTLNYTYDNGRLATSTNAEGGKIAFTLDSRGNATQTTTTPKTGATEIALVQSAAFPACTATNFRICNKPTYTIDARGARTDFDYDDSNGELKTMLAPADANNVRAVTRFNYGLFYPAPGVIAPAGTTLVSVSLLTNSYQCLASTVTGTTIDFSYVCGAGQRNATTYAYTPSTSTARTNFELEGVIVDSDTTARRTCYRYDVVGNRIAETKPLAGLSACP